MIDWKFDELRHLSKSSLLDELLDTHQNLANLHEKIGWLRAQELVGAGKGERLEAEGIRDAYVEKKFLLLRLLDNVSAIDVRERT
jgi:hypothetical protein